MNTHERADTGAGQRLDQLSKPDNGCVQWLCDYSRPQDNFQRRVAHDDDDDDDKFILMTQVSSRTSNAPPTTVKQTKMF
jgi:hypothetical protein